MEQVTDRDRVVEILKEHNPGAREDLLHLYAGAFLDYAEAEGNIRRNGNIVKHPRTASPMENPYLKVKAAAAKLLQSITKVRNTGPVWDLLDEFGGEGEENGESSDD